MTMDRDLDYYREDEVSAAYARIKELEDDCKFLLAFAPFGYTPENLSPMFYKTGTYEGDVELCERIKKIQLSMHPVKRESDGETIMTKLEELKAASDAAEAASDAARDAYQAELKKTKEQTNEL